MTDGRGAAMWAVRMILIWAGAWLASHGVGDAQLWGGFANAVAPEAAGALVSLVGLILSWRARKQQLAAEPPG